MQRLSVLLVRCPAIENDAAARHNLIEEIKVANIARQDRATQFLRLQIKQGVVKEFSLVALSGGEACQTKQSSRKHSGRAPNIGIDRVKAVAWDVLDSFAKDFQSGFRIAMAWVEPTESMGQLGKANR